MAISVSTNIASLNAQRNLANSQLTLNKTLNRLSSGLRVNSAADDAAGMAIGSNLTSQINGMNQASRNVGDGQSLLGTADGALASQADILQRMRELAVQASTDTNSSANRVSINNEASQSKAELERIARTTMFNGNNLLDGSFQGKDIQVGANSTANDRIAVSLSSSKAADIGQAYKVAGGAATANALAAGDVTLTVNGTSFTVGGSVTDGVSSTGATASALAKANAINAISSSTNVTAEATTTVTGTNAQVAGSILAGELTINGVDMGAITLAGATDQTAVNAINSNYSKTGVTATLNAANKIVLTAADGRNVDVTAAAGASEAGLVTGTTYGAVTLRSTDAFTVGGANPAANAGLTPGAAALATTENVNAIDLTSKSGAQLAVKIIDVALSQINSRRADIGALTNRFTTTTSNLSSAVENASASKSRIMDADFAMETATMSRSQILQQAGVAILSQANQGPQLALSLLR